jgi:hypothetical protein
MSASASNEKRPEPNGGPRERQPPLKSEPARAASKDETEQFVFTRRVATGEVIKAEMIGSDGQRHAISPKEAAALVGKDELHEIESAIDEACEAGISGVLDLGWAHDDMPENEDEAALRRALLTVIIGAGARRRLQRRIAQRLMLSRAVSH